MERERDGADDSLANPARRFRFHYQTNKGQFDGSNSLGQSENDRMADADNLR